MVVIIYILQRYLEGCFLLQFCDFKCINYNYRRDIIILRYGDFYVIGNRLKLKLNYIYLKKKDGIMFFFIFYIYNLIFQFRYVW